MVWVADFLVTKKQYETNLDMLYANIDLRGQRLQCYKSHKIKRIFNSQCTIREAQEYILMLKRAILGLPDVNWQIGQTLFCVNQCILTSTVFYYSILQPIGTTLTCNFHSVYWNLDVLLLWTWRGFDFSVLHIVKFC